jgi:NAD(P)-dependent dehydrogenase (short-subunit alcohol dehydrogenase family)
VVNNAGIIRWAGLPEVDAENIESHLSVHLLGSFNTIRAAWPTFVEQRYGRIVNTTSSGMFGLPNNPGYAAAKAGVVGLTRSVAVAGAEHGITANLVAPAAYTRMAGARDDDDSMMAAHLVAPMVAFLAHEDCPVSGEVYAAGAGRFARIFIAQAPGFVDESGAPTVEDVAAHWDEINDEAGYTVPADLMAWSSAFLAHLA